MARPPSKLVRERRRKIVDGLLEIITQPNGVISSEEFENIIMIGAYFEVPAFLDKFLQQHVNAPELQTEMHVSIIVHLLNRLLRNPEPPAAAQS